MKYSGSAPVNCGGRCESLRIFLPGGNWAGGFAIDDGTKVVWRDTSQVWQENDFGGDVNEQPVNLRARNRMERAKLT